MTLDIINVIANLLIASGLLTTLVFYRQNRRKASAEATTSEHEANNSQIDNLHLIIEDLRLEKKSDAAKIEELEKCKDKLYTEKSADRKQLFAAMKQTSALELRAQAAEFKTCSVRGCQNREPQTGY